MAGLALGGRVSGKVTAAQTPSTSGSTIGKQAFGVTQGGGSGKRGKRVACATVGAGVASTVFLVWLYWSLPH